MAMATAAKTKEKPVEAKNYKGFVAGVFSGIAKLSGKQSLQLSSLNEVLVLFVAYTNQLKSRSPI